MTGAKFLFLFQPMVALCSGLYERVLNAQVNSVVDDTAYSATIRMVHIFSISKQSIWCYTFNRNGVGGTTKNSGLFAVLNQQTIHSPLAIMQLYVQYIKLTPFLISRKLLVIDKNLQHVSCKISIPYFSDLMKLKRTGSKNSQKKKEKSEAFISRQAPGMCFDFHHKVRDIDIISALF